MLKYSQELGRLRTNPKMLMSALKPVPGDCELTSVKISLSTAAWAKTGRERCERRDLTQRLVLGESAWCIGHKSVIQSMSEMQYCIALHAPARRRFSGLKTIVIVWISQSLPCSAVGTLAIPIRRYCSSVPCPTWMTIALISPVWYWRRSGENHVFFGKDSICTQTTSTSFGTPPSKVQSNLR